MYVFDKSTKQLVQINSLELDRFFDNRDPARYKVLQYEEDVVSCLLSQDNSEICISKYNYYIKWDENTYHSTILDSELVQVLAKIANIKVTRI